MSGRNGYYSGRLKRGKGTKDDSTMKGGKEGIQKGRIISLP
jgi:hypothetical protein